MSQQLCTRLGFVVFCFVVKPGLSSKFVRFFTQKFTLPCLASSALNISCSFDQSARSIESRSVVMTGTNFTNILLDCFASGGALFLILHKIKHIRTMCIFLAPHIFCGFTHLFNYTIDEVYQQNHLKLCLIISHPVETYLYIYTVKWSGLICY